ncbi:hypothetical protein SAMN05428975_3547 [Mucilaginibacter sp. OK268]|uniref:PIN domain-containing protein n=1 Tax=Mucilaginibacter sp. OK268 TaxID=1881048 RepID=UPI00088A8EF0|nr:PIN domain-containing protein [Mucilaginibacter sp. OK268]SDP91312.1 hypothetical protein SAMN05428975_3547 [Mucilaginibacter sp. OK268]
MITLVLDTNIWIYLTKEIFHELWTKLKEEKEKEGYTVLVNDIILLEWERNKAKTISNLADSIKTEYQSAKNLAKFLTGDAKNKFEESIANYKDEAKRIQMATERVEEVEQFMRNCKLIEVTEAQKLFIANLAMKKEPPFQNNKNNFNDALIFRNICEATEDAFPFAHDLIYVSNNPDDLIDKQTKEVHVSLTEGLKPINVKNVTELGEALKLAPELIEDFDEWLEDQLDQQAQYEYDIARGK